ncbi:embryonal Fyn-associated substrate isoform X2 [Tachyglossus aculeatus]|uniref:embryonal Fyn-associated substrate isoform X2 n=1 Tax=Tachyglossus aculeatus TaxID=9261 RepID=UPI0018F433CE|nr:embryonal Fyn-associated substrate isoform X2 [Tachyglossus aculeatus]
MAVSVQLARALYDNTAESPEELSFRRGDVLRVLQGEGAGGLPGWCLCSLHGQRGIVPANRVRLLPSSPTPDSSLYQVPPARPEPSNPCPGAGETEQEVYVVPPPARPCSALGPPPSPETIYKVPRDPAGDSALEVYDIPPSALRGPASGPYDAPAPFSRPLACVAPQAPAGEDAPYDVPPALKPPPEPDLELEGGREPGPPVYAFPSNLKRASALLNLYEAPEELLGEATGSEDGIYDVPVLGPEEPPAPALPPPPAPSDLETLTLLLARSPPPPPRPRLPSAESLSRRPLPALPVSEPAAPSPAPSPASGRKGSIQDRPLPPPPPRLPTYGGPKADGDGEGREGGAGAAAEASNEYEGIQLGEEYDYVHLKGVSKDQGAELAAEISLPEESELLLPESLLQKEQEAFSPSEPLALPAGDLQLLHFYAGQCRGHYAALRAAVAALLASAQANQPPRLFVPHGKRVVVAAHRLVFVGDTLGRLASSAPLRARVGAAGAALGQALRATVLAVKGAALGYPSGPAARELAQCVAELADRAGHFTCLLGGLAG